jgi:hypothetical protein
MGPSPNLVPPVSPSDEAHPTRPSAQISTFRRSSRPASSSLQRSTGSSGDECNQRTRIYVISLTLRKCPLKGTAASGALPARQLSLPIAAALLSGALSQSKRRERREVVVSCRSQNALPRPTGIHWKLRASLFPQCHKFPIDVWGPSIPCDDHVQANHRHRTCRVSIRTSRPPVDGW